MAEGDLYRAVISYNVAGVLCQNALYFKALLGVGAEELVNELHTTWFSYWQYCAHSSCRIVSYYAQRMNNLEIQSALKDPEYDQHGAQSGEVMPAHISAVVSLKTGVYGRSYRGRLYHSGWVSSWIDDGRLSSTAISALNTFFGGFHGLYKVGGDSDSWEYGVYSKKRGGDTIPYSLSGWQPYTEFIPKLAVGTQRSRLT